TGLVLAVVTAQAQNLSKTERRIVDAVSRNFENQLEFVEKVVNINSGTMNHDGVRKVGQVFSDAFGEIGFGTQWLDMPAEMDRAGHLFAEIKGTKGKRVLLIGHLDTVFE